MDVQTASARRKRGEAAAPLRRRPPPTLKLTIASLSLLCVIMGLQTVSAWRKRVAAEAALRRRRRPPTIVGREQVLGLSCCEELAAASLHDTRVVTTAIPVLYAAGAHGSPRNWSALPDLPLSIVVGRLHSLKDFLAFRGVCASWRTVGAAAAAEVMASPLFFGSLVDKNNARRFYHPVEDRVYVGNTPLLRPAVGIIGVSHGYFILEWFGRATILNPLTGEEKHVFPRSKRGLGAGSAVLSSPPTSPGCVLVEWDLRNIQFCRPRDQEWCQVLIHRPPQSRRRRHRDDEVLSVAVVGGKGYALIRDVGLGSFDLTAGRSTVMLTVVDTMLEYAGDQLYSRSLAESDGELLALPAIGRNTDRFPDVPVVVFRFDVSSRKWVALDDLGGRAVLVQSRKCAPVFVDGDGCSLERWGGINKDCVYACWSLDGKLLEYKMNDHDTSHPSYSPRFAQLRHHTLFGRWVNPRLLLSPFRLYG